MLGMKCGPSNQEKSLAGQQASFSSLLSSNYQQQFKDQSDILSSLNHAMSPIVAAGPNQQGFSGAELADLNTRATNNTGAAYRNAAQATGAALAGRGNGGAALPGGSSGLISGVDKQIRGSQASAAAGQLAGQENEIGLKNYEVGRENFFNAAGGQRALAGLYNPEGYAGQASGANAQAFGQADKISNEENQKSASILGGITSLASSALTFGAGGFGNLGAGQSFGEGVGDFFKGGASALANG